MLRQNNKYIYFKYLYMIIALLLTIPTLMYYLKNKTILGFDYFLRHDFQPLGFNINPNLFIALFVIVIFLLGLSSFYISEREEIFFKNKKDIFIFLTIVSTIFIFVIPISSQDIYYYFGEARLFEHYNINPYRTTILEFVNSNPNIIQTDEIIHQAYINKWNEFLCPYPPLWILITSIFTKLSLGNIDICLFISKVFFAITNICCSVLIQKIFHNKKLTILYSLSPFVLINFICELHNDMFLFLFILLSLYFLINKKNILLSVTMLGIAAAIKYIAIIYLPFIVIYHFKNLNIKQRFLKCIKYGVIFIIPTLLTMIKIISFQDLYNILKNQQTYIANNFYHILGQVTNANVIVATSKIIFILFFILYAICCIRFICKKDIEMDSMFNYGFVMMIFFLFFVITNYRIWYMIWLIPFANKHTKSISIISIIGTILLFITKDSSLAFSIFYYILITIYFICIFIVNYIQYKKKENLYV